MPKWKHDRTKQTRTVKMEESTFDKIKPYGWARKLTITATITQVVNEWIAFREELKPKGAMSMSQMAEMYNKDFGLIPGDLDGENERDYKSEYEDLKRGEKRDLQEPSCMHTLEDSKVEGVI